MKLSHHFYTLLLLTITPFSAWGERTSDYNKESKQVYDRCHARQFEQFREFCVNKHSERVCKQACKDKDAKGADEKSCHNDCIDAVKKYYAEHEKKK